MRGLILIVLLCIKCWGAADDAVRAERRRASITGLIGGLPIAVPLDENHRRCLHDFFEKQPMSNQLSYVVTVNRILRGAIIHPLNYYGLLLIVAHTGSIAFERAARPLRDMSNIEQDMARMLNLEFITKADADADKNEAPTHHKPDSSQQHFPLIPWFPSVELEPQQPRGSGFSGIPWAVSIRYVGPVEGDDDSTD